MATSVAKNGGFYIGRYETSLNANSKAQSKKDEEAMVKTNWYNMYNYQRNIYGTGNVTTSMIWGCQWDQVMLFLEDKGYNVKDSSSWGNHKNSAEPANIPGYGEKQVTGYSSYWKALNIYDLAGNVLEWTQEAYANYRVGRRRIF